MAISLLVVFLYGGMIWGLFPLDETISFESHIYGSVSGVMLAIYYRKFGPQKEIYSWETEDDDDGTDVPWNDPKYMEENENPERETGITGK